MSQTQAERQAKEDFQSVVGVLQRIRKRVLLDRLLHNASTDLLVSLTFFVLLLLCDRVLLPGLAGLSSLGAVILVSLAVSLARTLLVGRLDLFRTAVLADKRLGLKERASSAVYAQDLVASSGPEGLGEWGLLIQEDAARFLSNAELEERFPVRLPRSAAWIALPVLVSMGLSLWLPSLDLLGVLSRRDEEARWKSAVAEEKKELDGKLAQLEKDAKDKAPEARKLLELLRERALNSEKEPSERQKTAEGSGDPRRDALVEMTRREDEIKKGLEGKKLEPLKDALKALKSIDLKNAELTRNLSAALKEGDFEKAKKALEDLKGELSSLSEKKPSQLTPDEKARLEKLSAELSRLSKDTKTLSKLSTALSRASAELDASNFPGALESMSASKEELESLASLADEADVLDQALELVRLSKEELSRLQSCPQCGTPYCPDCGKPRCGCKPGTKPGGT